jgi:formylmethanofuran dehydrogenase subunit A
LAESILPYPMGRTVGSCVSARVVSFVSPPYDSKIEEDVRQHFRKANTVSFDNYSILANHLPLGEMIPCG